MPYFSIVPNCERKKEKKTQKSGNAVLILFKSELIFESYRRSIFQSSKGKIWLTNGGPKNLKRSSKCAWASNKPNGKYHFIVVDPFFSSANTQQMFTEKKIAYKQKKKHT